MIELASGALLDIGIYNIFYAMIFNNFQPIIKHSSSVRLVNNANAWNSVDLIFKNGVTTHFTSTIDIPIESNSHDSIIYGSKGFIKSQNFNRQVKAEVHIYKNNFENDNDLVEEINESFNVNGFEYQVIEATECILKGKNESDIHNFQHSIELCKIMDILFNDWDLKYLFEKEN